MNACVGNSLEPAGGKPWSYQMMHWCENHNSGVIMSAMASQTTGVSSVYATVCYGVDHRKHQCSASLAFVRGIHRWPVNSPHKGPVMRKMLPFHDVIIVVKSIKFSTLTASEIDMFGKLPVQPVTIILSTWRPSVSVRHSFCITWQRNRDDHNIHAW